MKRLILILLLLLWPASSWAQVGNFSRIVLNGVTIISGNGTPEGAVVGAPGDVFISTNGAIYTKAAASGTDNSGWVASGGAGSGTVTSVGLTMPGIFSVSGTPVTASGTIGVSLGNQSANRVWAGPASGSAAAPTFRQVVFGDWASNSCATGQIPKYDGAAWVCDDDAGASSGAPNDAQYLTLATDATLTNERVLTAGTGVTFTDAGAGSTLTVAADGANITSLSAGNISSGTLAVARGGTNLTSATDDNVMVGNGTTWQSKAIGDCDDSGGNHLNYDTTTNAFSCGTSSSGGGSGTVTNTGTLTSGKTIIGNGSADVTVSSLTANLVTSSSGTLAGATAAANSRVLGSGASGSGSAYSEMTLGANLGISGTTLDVAIPLTNDGNSSTALTINWNSAATGRHRFTLTDNVTLTFSNPVDGGTYVLLINTGAGSFTVTWPGTVLWAGGTAPTITTAASKVDLVTLIYDSTATKYYGSYNQSF